MTDGRDVRGQQEDAQGRGALHGAEHPQDFDGHDGYLALVQADGAVHGERFVDLGRGDFFSALTWTDEGLLAVGATGWNRWSGGMSLSRGSQPLLVLAPLDASPVLQRTLAVEQRDRHTHLLDVDVAGNEVIAVGQADAPMTHSGDAAVAPMAMGSLKISLP